MMMPPGSAQADRVGVDGVDLGERGCQRHPGRSAHLDGDRGGDGLVADHEAVDERHDVERRAVDRVVRGEADDRRDGHVGGGERRDDAELPAHVVRGGQHVPGRRAAQHPRPVGRIRHAEGEVGAPPGDELERQRRLRIGVLGEPGGDRRDVDAGDGGVVAHRRRT